MRKHQNGHTIDFSFKKLDQSKFNIFNLFLPGNFIFFCIKIFFDVTYPHVKNIYYSNCDFPGKNILKVLLFIFSTMGPTSPNSFSLAHHNLLHQIEIVNQSHCIPVRKHSKSVCALIKHYCTLIEICDDQLNQHVFFNYQQHFKEK